MKSANGGKKGDSKLDLGDFLGRSRDGFQPLKQEDDDDVGAVVAELGGDAEAKALTRCQYQRPFTRNT